MGYPNQGSIREFNMQFYIRFFAIFNLLNGVAMLIWPEPWYNLTPGVSGTGPFNPHFVRDIGIAFAASGIGLWFGVTDSALRPWSGPIVAIGFLGGHAVFHVVEMFAHHLDARAVTRDMILIVIPASIAFVWLVRELGKMKESNADIMNQPSELKP
jgi:hypothetical protein